MKNNKFYSKPVPSIFISIIIYCILFLILYAFSIKNESIIGYVNEISIYIQPRPNFLLIEHISKLILPLVFLLNSIFCGLIIFIFNKIFSKNFPEKFIQIRNYLIRISILVLFVFFINYIKSFSDNRKIINKYHEIR